jgi:DHA2 family multidrug resistance protein
MALMPRTLVMVAVMPIVGKLYNRFPPALFAAVGLFFAAFGQYLLSGLTLDSNSSHVIGAIMLQGIGMSLIIVPLSTVSLSEIPRHRMADATGLSSLLRQIGGSIGLAIFATYLANNGVINREYLKAHVTDDRPEVTQRLAATELGLQARGMDPGTAHNASLMSLAGTVARQGTVLAFDKTFILGALLFASVLPFVFFLRRPKGVSSGPAHVEIEL